MDWILRNGRKSQVRVEQGRVKQGRVLGDWPYKPLII